VSASEITLEIISVPKPKTKALTAISSFRNADLQAYGAVAVWDASKPGFLRRIKICGASNLRAVPELTRGTGIKLNRNI
jgi:hypothetical protein